MQAENDLQKECCSNMCTGAPASTLEWIRPTLKRRTTSSNIRLPLGTWPCKLQLSVHTTT